MLLNDHDLRQFDESYLDSLSEEQIRRLTLKLLQDLKTAREQINQTSDNSSRPPSSSPPWRRSSGPTERSDDDDDEDDSPTAPPPASASEPSSSDTPPEPNNQPQQPKKKPGRQPGAPGHGRKVTLPLTGTELHRPEVCAGCDRPFSETTPFAASTGLYVLDVKRSELGLEVTHVKHIYGGCECECGHVTRTEPGRCGPEAEWQVELTEWHLVGPMLAALLVSLSLRMRLSRAKIQELLHEWLGIELSIGVINQTITEVGRAAAPLEQELIELVQEAEVLHVDETGWPEGRRRAWLWVLTATGVTLFLIGNRSWAVIANVLEKFAGWLMSDGYGVYRQYGQRLRCLAHLVRKARGLAESLTPEAQAFGQQVLRTLTRVMEEVYKARAGPAGDLTAELATELAALKKACQAHRDSSHDKTRALARELLNDWESFWQVLKEPQLPLTNNPAEQALRHWVITRKITQGTRTEQGSRAFTLLASVIETCRQRGILPWPYLAEVLAARRRGQPAPSLPSAPA